MDDLSVDGAGRLTAKTVGKRRGRPRKSLWTGIEREVARGRGRRNVRQFSWPPEFPFGEARLTTDTMGEERPQFLNRQRQKIDDVWPMTDRVFGMSLLPGNPRSGRLNCQGT